MSYLDMDLLRFSTAGSVDDGKSTLIGRLLYDSKSIFEDQMEAIEKTSKNTGEEGVNLALLTDGLRAEREQKITIDVAYRYFATPKRKFIIADTPGHIQYTRNMVTGASTADLAIILVDARKGVLTQSRRHSFIASLLQIPHLVVAVNKMDLVDYSQKRFNEIVDDYKNFAQKLEIDDITFIPMSALKGDNIVNKGENMPWYNGSTLLHTLENVNVGSRRNLIDFRYPVQHVIRPNQDFRGFAGTIVSGTIKVGEEITVLPSRFRSKVKEIWKYNEQVQEAVAGEATVITIEDEIDISRGDMIVRSGNVPKMTQEFEAFLCWMNETPMDPSKNYYIQHTTRTSMAVPVEVRYKINVDSLHREETNTLELNEIGRVRLKVSQHMFIDPYKINNATGSFILIDTASNVTVGAGMIRGIDTADTLEEPDLDTKRVISPNVVWEPWNIPREEREKRSGHAAKVLWFTGISGAGKSTIARELEKRLFDAGKQTMLLDGDQVRHGLNGDLGFSPADRTENIRRVGEVSRMFFEHGNIVLCTFVSPYRKDRDQVRKLFPDGSFIEIHVTCTPEAAIERDPKGLYKKAQAGEIKNLTGFNADYEAPESSDAIVIDTTNRSVDECVDELMKFV
ncbi:MAG TPA: bifunctional sulfate adenylyltransferase subunit 1/adenylylsulfate kinase [Bacteroidetes bacterium]|nr:bifunctional sulfate adenylyltransferase subunit 1/adenylylsulfate kinase [Bacteroidota bacterium]